MKQEIKVVFEDEWILAINKPPGIICNRSETTQGLDTLQDWVERQKYWKNIDKDLKIEAAAEYFFARSGLVHRLDKDTSGVMILAKTVFSYQNLVTQFSERRIKKEYIALVHGWLKPKNGSIVLPLSRSSRNRKKFAVSSRGRKAKTLWEVLDYYTKIDKKEGKAAAHQGFSLVKLKPITGRTHQIRVHLSHIKHPIVGDEKYVGKRRSREDKKWCPRQFLHAFSLEILHPKDNCRKKYQSKLSVDLVRALSFLKK